MIRNLLSRKPYKKIISRVLIVTGILLVFWSILPYVGGEIWYLLIQMRHKNFVLDSSQSSVDAANGSLNPDYRVSVFGRLLSTEPEIMLPPANRDFSLVIEKIGLSVPVVRGVSVTDSVAYHQALKNGVAHALVSDLPSQDYGNVYLFAHASLNFWKLGKYATAFNLLRKLEPGDEINVFYHDKRYLYTVVNSEIYPGWNTYPLTRAVIEPILTLQTCDPPGTTLNRLVVTAKLAKVYD